MYVAFDIHREWLNMKGVGAKEYVVAEFRIDLHEPKREDEEPTKCMERFLMQISVGRTWGINYYLGFRIEINSANGRVEEQNVRISPKGEIFSALLKVLAAKLRNPQETRPRRCEITIHLSLEHGISMSARSTNHQLERGLFLGDEFKSFISVLVNL